VIFVHVRHGRSSKDAQRLSGHLLRLDDNEAVEVLPVVGCVADDLVGVLAAMRRLAPRPASAGLHHVSISPAFDCSNADLRNDADRILREIGADPLAHPHALVVHKKTSAGGRGELHAHLVFAHWGLDGKAIRDNWLRLRLERLAREIEFDRGEPLTRGRHDRALSKALIANGRDDVAVALGIDPTAEAPKSATTTKLRQKLKRQGVSDTDARAAVKAAWGAGKSPAAFRAALAASGLSIVPGSKPGVIMVVTTEGVEIGALDRILRVPRGELGHLKENSDEPAKPDFADRDRTPVADPSDRQHHDQASSAPRPSGGYGWAEPVGRAAGDVDRNPDGAAGDRGATEPDRTVPSLLADEEPIRRRRRRIRELAAGRVMAEVIDLTSLRVEVIKRTVAPHITGLEQIIAQSQACIQRAKTPLPPPAELNAAIARRDRTKATANKARTKTHRLKTTAARIAADEPKGLSRLFAWFSGALRRHRASLAAALEAAERQRQMQATMDFIAKGAAFKAELETERAAKATVRESMQRRQMQEEAREKVLCAQTAMAMVARDDVLAFMPLDELLHRAWVRRRQIKAEEARRERTSSYGAPSPRMR
jgi:hypothetical protein